MHRQVPTGYNLSMSLHEFYTTPDVHLQGREGNRGMYKISL